MIGINNGSSNSKAKLELKTLRLIPLVLKSINHSSSLINSCDQLEDDKSVDKSIAEKIRSLSNHDIHNLSSNLWNAINYIGVFNHSHTVSALDELAESVETVEDDLHDTYTSTTFILANHLAHQMGVKKLDKKQFHTVKLIIHKANQNL